MAYNECQVSSFLINYPGATWCGKGRSSCLASFTWETIINIFWSTTQWKPVYIFPNCSITSLLRTCWPIIRYWCCKLTWHLSFCLDLDLNWYICRLFQDAYNNADTIISSALAEWEVILCTSNSLDPVWAQVLPDPFLRRLIVRYLIIKSF